MASQRPSVICLAETHLDSPVFGDSCPVVADLQSALPLYTLFNFPHTRRSGGILVAVLSSIHAVVLPELCIPPAGRCSSHVVSLNLFPTGSAPVRLITVYRQPGDPLTRYRSAVLPILSLAAATVLPTIFVGDFNASADSWNPHRRSDEAGRALRSWADGLCLTNANEFFARGTPTFGHDSVLDLCWLSPSALAMTSGFLVDDAVLTTSDHHSICLDLLSAPAYTDLPSYWGSTDHVNWPDVSASARYAAECGNVELTARAGCDPLSEVDRLEQGLRSIFLNLASVFMYKRPWSRPPAPLHGRSATAREYRALSRVVSSRRRRHAAAPALVLERYLSLRAVLKVEALAARERSKSAWLDKMLSTDGKVAWSNLKKAAAAGRDSVAPIGVTACAGGPAPLCPRASLDNLAGFFESQFCASRVLHDDGGISDAVALHSAGLQSPSDHAPPPITLPELQSAISLLDSSTSCGFDDVPAVLVCKAPELLLELLLRVFNYSLLHGVVPTMWKTALITPLHKGGSPADAANWRPIAVTSVLARTFERIMLHRIEPVILAAISPLQAGFQAGRSMCEHFIVLIHAAVEAMRCSSFRPMLFLDLTRAYDSVWIEALLYKLSIAGLDVSLIKWLQSFLCDRRYRVRWKSLASAWFSSIAGIGQGTVLGCLLFIFYFNDVTKLTPAVTTCLNADDVLTIPTAIGSDGINQLATALPLIQHFCDTWRLRLSPTKSACVVFKNSSMQQVPPFQFQTRSGVIPIVHSTKYLGVICDANLSFREQRDVAVRKARRLAGYISHSLLAGPRSVPIPPKICRTLASMIVQSSCLYASEFWLVGCKPVQAKLDRAVSSVLNISTSLPPRFPARGLLVEFGLPPSGVDCEFRLLSLCSRVLNTPINTAAKLLLQTEYCSAVGSNVSYRTSSVGECLYRVSATWSTPPTVSLRVLRDKKAELSFSRWSASPVPRALSVAKPLPGMALYLSREASCSAVRASFRFETLRTLLRQHRFSRPAVSSDCPACPGEIQSVDHLLLSCPLYAARRAALAASLGLHGVPATSAIMRGAVEQLPEALRSWCLRITFPFLNLIHLSLLV